MKHLLIAGIFLLSFDTAFSFECAPSISSICRDNGCATSKNSITMIRLSKQDRTVTRCDTRGCDVIPVEVRESGVMLKAGAVDSGYLLVVNTISNEFTEIATAVVSAYVKSGSCQ